MSRRDIDPEEWRRQGRLKEMAEHVDRLAALLHQQGVDELDEELKLIREVIAEIGS